MTRTETAVQTELPGAKDAHAPFRLNEIYQGDCIEIMNSFPAESVDLIFADPPFNIGIEYDSSDDKRRYEEYVEWSEKWIDAAIRLLKKTGSLYIAIGDEYAAEIRMIGRRKNLFLRNWIIWYYTFGQHQRKKFSRAHTHIFYWVLDEQNFTFNIDAIRVPSARQTVYADRRAHPNGRVPDDVWNFSRVCGTFKERVGKHPCQMPEALLDRIALASSNKGDLVLDPFCGTGTTVAVAHGLRRRYIGIDISERYCELTRERLRQGYLPVA
jgi:site-specific DNA-methyltransferase (adenine-specific)